MRKRRRGQWDIKSSLASTKKAAEEEQEKEEGEEEEEEGGRGRGDGERVEGLRVVIVLC